MNQTEQTAHITPLQALSTAVICLQRQIDVRAERIERLEKGIKSGTADLTGIITDICDRIERLEAALQSVVRCLIDGKVDMAAPMPDELHGHRILGSESVQAMVEVRHQLEK